VRKEPDGALPENQGLARVGAQVERRAQEVRNLQVMQMRPDQSAKKLKLLAELERSARAGVKLRLKALAYARSRAQKPN
jgi:hypothetical protein